MRSLFAFGTGLACLIGQAAYAEEIIVFAAASLTDAVTEISDQFERQSGHTVIPVFASSASLARQIEQYAPADIFISANVEWMDHLESQSLLVPNSRQDLVANELVIVEPAEGPVDDVDLSDLTDLLGDGGRLAIGDPDAVPAGIYAAQALTGLGLWEELAPRTARAANVRGALAMVARGEAPYGIVYATDAAISDQVTIVATLPSDSHAPIVYPAALIANPDRSDGNLAQAYLDYLAGDDGDAVFRRFGFLPIDGGA